MLHSTLLKMKILFIFIPIICCSCGESPQKTPSGSWPDGLNLYPDGGKRDVFDDLGALPDLVHNAEGPTINITSPANNEVIIGDVLKVQATITDKDGIDDQSVEVTLNSEQPVKMTLTTTPNVYEALVDVSTLVGRNRLWVQAADLLGNVNNSEVVEFKRDPGPTITFLSPEADGRYRGSVSIQVSVADSIPITLFEIRIGTYKLKLSQTGSDPLHQIWVGTVKFDDPEFNPPLADKQVLIAVAENQNQAHSTAQQIFWVDNQGPTIDIKSQIPGELIGKIIQIQAEIVDLAGVLSSSVKCVIGNQLDNRTISLKNSASSPNIFEAEFDTRTLSQFDLWPVISVRAADKLGNESHYDIQVGLDNGQPILELDPPENFYLGRIKERVLECSKPFDPVGSDAVNDKDMVPQIAEIRTRIEDQGNHVPSAEWEPVAGIDNTTTWLYVLDDTTNALVIDTDGDGFCDDINPEVIPLGSNPKKGDAVAVNIAPVPQTGSGDFTPYPVTDTTPLHSDCERWGTDKDPPEPLCLITPLTVAIFNTIEMQASIYVIPPITSGKKTYGCLGLPFDFRVNSFANGWACVAAVASDNLGNKGVSPPLRLYVDLTLQSPAHPPAPSSAGEPPNCTGTLNKSTGKVDSSKPCTFRSPSQPFRQRYSSGELLIPP